MFTKILHNSGLLAISAVLLGSIAMSCRDDESIFDNTRTPESALVISTMSADTRADNGDEHFAQDPFGEPSTKQEEAIITAELYFFKSDKDTDPAFHHISLTGIDKITRAELSLKIPMNRVNYFVQKEGSNEKTAYIYALVNMPDRNALPDNDEATLYKLQQIRVSNPGFTSAAIPASFVMRGGSTVTLTGTDHEAKIKGWIPVERLAAKVRMFCNIQGEVYLDKDGKTIYKKDGESEEDFLARRNRDYIEKWVPRPQTTGTGAGKDNTFLYFYNFTTNAVINGSTGTVEDENFTRHDWLTYDNIDRSQEKIEFARVVSKNTQSVNVPDYEEEIAGTKKIDRSKYPYTHQTAFYSYPNIWKSDDIEETHATNVTMRLQWECVEDKANEGSNRLEYFYYQIPVNRLAKSENDFDRIDPNTYYRILVDIAMLGAKDLGTALEVDASWEALPWGGADVDVSIKGRRYLVVNQTEWTMNNVSHINIPFSSSHDTEVKCYVTYFRYNDVWGKDNDTSSEEKHESPEFINWVAAAQGKGIKETEGEIRQNNLKWGETTANLNQILYYKKNYFYDEIYETEFHKYDDDDPQHKYGEGYKYYIGHEHPKTFQEDYIHKPTDFTDDGWTEFDKKYTMQSIYTCTVNKDESVISFDHPLVWWKEAYREINDKGYYYYVPEMKNNKLRDEYSRCEITIIIRHADRPEDEHLFEEVIHVTQYPGMYVEVSHDYGRPMANTTDEGNLYVRVNGNPQEKNGLPTNWWEVSYYLPFFGLINNNPNMYVIHTSQLSEDVDGNYIIGDPRSLYYNNLLGTNDHVGDASPLTHTTNIENPDNNWNNWDWSLTWGGIEWNPIPMGIANAKRLYDPYDSGEGPLKYYYPADETEPNKSGSKEQFIAPSFRIASSFGKVSLSYSNAEGLTNTNYLDQESRKQARRRCAAYQEAGRPAGRWRVPTYAEIEYVMQLSKDKKIPHLFGLIITANNPSVRDKTELYWCATSLLAINVTDNTLRRLDSYNDINKSPAVRCVYDEWYWTEVDKERSKPYEPNPIEREFIWGDRLKDNTQH